MSDELTPFIEPELEARLIALILGEASDFEREELEKLINERPELAAWKARMENVHELVSEASTPSDDSEWKLSTERREKVLSQFGKTPSTKAKEKKPRRFNFPWRASAAAAALVAMLPVTVGLLTVLTQGDDFLLGDVMAKRQMTFSAEEEISPIDASVDDTDGYVGKQFPQEDQKMSSRRRSLALEERVVRQDVTARVEEMKKNGKDAFAKGDYEGATTKLREALDILPASPATETQRESIEQILDHSAIAQAQANRRTGKYAEARSLLEEVVERDPKNEVAKKSLEHLDDPIRTNPGLSYADTKEVDEIRQHLYKGEGLYNLGLYDKAEEEFKETLRKDPYNKAARRWIERTDAIDSPYYNAAYDQTRAQMLMEVDGGWELAVPPIQAEEKMANVRRGGVGPAPKKSPSAPAPKVEDYLVSGNEGGNGRGEGAVRQEAIAGILNVPQEEISEFEFAKKAVQAEQEITTKTFSIPHNFLSSLDEVDGFADDGAADPFADDSSDGPIIAARKSMKELLEQQGVTFPEGSSAQFMAGAGKLIVRNTPENMELMASMVESANLKLPVIRTRANNPKSYGYYIDNERFDSGEKTSKVVEKLQSVRLPSLELKNASLDEALALIEESLNSVDDDAFDQAELKVAKPRHLQAEKMAELGDLSQGSPVIDSLNLKDVPLQTALEYIADKTKMKYQVNENGIQMLPLGDTETDEIITRSWKVEPSFLEFLNPYDRDRFSGASDPFADDDEVEEELTTRKLGIRELLESQGVTFTEGASAQILENGSRLLVRNTPTNLELLESIVEAHEKDRRRKELEEIRRNALRANNEISATEKPDSTFSLNVSDVSFKLAKAALLGEAQMPAEEQIRVEEFVNAFDYQDASPSQSQKVSCVIEQAAHPLMQQRELMRIAMKTAALGRNATTPLRLTILLDRSGSMERVDRAESVSRAFQLLSAHLTATDEVTLVAFDRRTRLLAERLKGDQCAKLAQLIRQAPTEGGTNLEEALTTGLQLATQQYLEEAQNRVILLTDGAANLGDAVPARLAAIVARMRKQGVSFDACGVGADGLNDAILEELARQGDGRYYFLDRPEDADAGFAKQIAGALRPAAKNVKVQVIFNPERVGKYRLYGYKKHLLKKEDFRNDAVDAAEMAAEESGVAMYHYEALPDGRGEIGTVAVRFFDVASGEMVERTWTIPYQEQVPSFEEAKPSLRLAASTIFFAEKLKHSRLGSQVELPKLIETVSELKPVFGHQKRFQELQQMLEAMR